MNRVALVFGLWFLTSTVFAQTGPTVADYFVASPYLGYGLGSGQQSDHWLHFSLDSPTFTADADRQAKRNLLGGRSLDATQPPSALVVDLKNGYLHLSFEFDDLTLVYFERADKSRVVAIRLGDTTGQFWTQEWAFFNVNGDSWEPWTDALPKDWLKTYLPESPGKTDADYLALTSFDLDLPRYGTTVHLIPQSYGSDLDGPEVKITVPGTARQVNYYAYMAWFNKTFANAKKQPLALELKWSKAKGGFEVGKRGVWPAE